jgi:hypothetical protein
MIPLADHPLAGLAAQLDAVDAEVLAVIGTADVEDLAAMFLSLVDSKARIADAARNVEEALAAVMPKRLELPDLPVMERRTGKDRKKWESEQLLSRVVRIALDPEATGEIPTDAMVAVDRVVSTIRDVMPVTPSLGWRVTALRALDLDPDEWCHVEPGRVTVQIFDSGRP